MKTPLIITSENLETTIKIGIEIGKLVQPGDCILLNGTLGVGKTQIVKGIGLGLNILDVVSSPTFVIIKSYEGKFKLHHVDLYRIDKTQELSQLGLYDLQLDGGIIAVEWANKAFEEFPEESLNINIKYSNQNNTRKITLSSSHQRYNKILKKLKDNFIK